MIGLNEYFESIINSDNCNIVICDLNHTIVYMNPSAVKLYGNLVGDLIFDCHNGKSNELIVKVVNWFKISSDNNLVHTYYNDKQQKDVYMIALRKSDGELIGYYEKHEYRAKDDSPLYNLT